MFQNPEPEGLGDAYNREMGVIFSGTRLCEAAPCHHWSQVDTCKEYQTSLSIPTRPTQELSSRTQKLPFCYKSVTPNFMLGGGPYPTVPCFNLEFLHFMVISLLLVLFINSHVVDLLTVFTCQCVILFRHFCSFLLMMCH